MPHHGSDTDEEDGDDEEEEEEEEEGEEDREGEGSSGLSEHFSFMSFTKGDSHNQDPLQDFGPYDSVD